MVKEFFKTHQMMLAYSGLCLAVFFWAVNTIIARGVVFQIRPITLSFYRWLVALIIILPFALPRLRTDFRLIKQHLGFLFFLSVPSVTAYNTILYLGAQYTTATNISMVVATMPVMTLAFSWIMNREKPALLKALGVMISLMGMLMIIARGSWQVLAALTFNPGDLLIVLSIASWAFYSVMLRRRQIDISPVSFLTVLIFFGVLCILPFYLWELTVFNGFEINGVTITIFLYLGICPSILSYICWNFGVKKAGASTASVFMYLLPVFTSILAVLFLNEDLFSYHFFGGAMILAGLMFSSLKLQ